MGLAVARMGKALGLRLSSTYPPAPQSAMDRAYVAQPFSEVRTVWIWA